MDPEQIVIVLQLAGAVAAGGVIGLERSWHGRSAGFRTHALVCLASSLLMMLTLYQAHWLPPELANSDRADPTRVAQGIMTGIGFLGAGVIFKEGMTVHGLTTAASVWVTAALGILIGAGFYFPAVAGVLLTLATLSALKWLESKLPTQFYVRHNLRFDLAVAPSESDVKALVGQHGFEVVTMSYHRNDGDGSFAYDTVLRTTDAGNVPGFAEALRRMEGLREFRLSPVGDQ